MERAEPELERTARRARRVLWAFRIVFYGGAFLALPGLLGLSKSEPRVVFLDGRTSQGHGFELMLRDGRPVHVRTGFDAPCDGSPWSTAWWERGATLRFDDGVVTIDSSWPAEFEDARWSGTHNATLRGELDDRDLILGTMRLHGMMHGPTGRYTCESGDVAFSARAG